MTDKSLPHVVVFTRAFNMNVKTQILQMINLVPEPELPTILEVIRHFVPAESEDIITPGDIAAHNIAVREYMAGETIAHDAIDWN